MRRFEGSILAKLSEQRRLAEVVRLRLLTGYNVQLPASAVKSVEHKIRGILNTVKDKDQAELIILSIVDDAGFRFTAGWLGWSQYEYARRYLDIPDGCWVYALWAENLESGRTKGSAEYWIGQWQDNEELNIDKVDYARESLDILMMDNMNLREVVI